MLKKTFTFACVHFTVAFTVAYLLTGSILVGSLVALIEPMCNTVAYHFHEKAWARWGNGGDGDGDDAGGHRHLGFRAAS